jgi:hypothetical protein
MSSGVQPARQISNSIDTINSPLLVSNRSNHQGLTSFEPTKLNDSGVSSPSNDRMSVSRTNGRFKIQCPDSMLGFEVSGIRQNSFAHENAWEFWRIRRHPAVQGEQFDILLKDGKVTVDGANVVKTDIACSNGVIHAVGSVIQPA